jgi:hypothetical protein
MAPSPPPQVPEQLGENRLRLQGDILHIECVGGLDLATMKRLTPIYQECISHFGYLLLLMDVRRSESMDMQARRHAVQWAKEYAAVQRTAVYGAPALLRGFLMLLNRATFLLSKGAASELVFVQSLAEGRTWLEKQRLKLANAAH